MYKNKKLFFIAEAGVNHENSIKLAEQIIKEAKLGGADSVKFQTYKAKLLHLNQVQLIGTLIK